ncbi:hypothetical protein [Actinomadura rupiterrae]|uniref:hypothetical protein n=1 Tax=Actinomadura rupiterrae TaxID=559627 RepID=UPI0020A2E48A|nr:hypothetical protein [Actinomadura rupiterrae]MCP2337541.1 dTMP kinase [Actinomadura rupiterrae]
MFIVLDGPAGSGKSALRDQLLHAAAERGIRGVHLGQFSWLSLTATRTIVALRAGQVTSSLASAVSAVRDDLALHVRHNLCRTAPLIVADRWTPSTACLLALLYEQPVGPLLGELALPEALPDMTILLTTPADLCRDRIRKRPASRRFLDADANLGPLTRLYADAAAACPDPVITRPSNQPSDLVELTEAVLSHQKGPR